MIKVTNKEIKKVEPTKGDRVAILKELHLNGGLDKYLMDNLSKRAVSDIYNSIKLQRFGREL
jgi:hypothetical protein